MAAQAIVPTTSCRPCWTGTREIYVSKAIDNSRLVKIEDPSRRREMKMFSSALACLFLLVMTFAWQHFKAIEYGYKIEALRTQRNELVDSNRTLRMQQAFLRDPERIDQLARKMGLQTPTAGQVIRMEATTPQNDMPVMASITPVSVISQR